MCVPTDLRRKIILKLIEALKDSQSFQNIDISQIKEAVLKSEHQTFEQSKNKDEYLYYINEKMKKIQQNSAQRFDKIEKFEFTGDNKDASFDKQDKSKIINGNIPPHVKISQMYSQEQIPQHFSNPSRKVESFAASFEQAKRSTESNVGYGGYSDPSSVKNPYLNQEQINYSNFQPWDQQVNMNYEKRNPISYGQSPQPYNHMMNNHIQHPNTISQSPNLHYNNRMYQPYPSPGFSNRGPSLPNDKSNIMEKEPFKSGYSNPYIKKSPIQYQERAPIEHSPHNLQNPRIQNTRANIKKASYPDYNRQTSEFSGFSPFVYRQPYSASMRPADSKMAAFMSKPEVSDYNNDQFMMRGSSPRVDSSDSPAHLNTDRYKVAPVNTQNTDPYSKPRDIPSQTFEPITRSFQSNFTKTSPRFNSQIETGISNKNTNFGNTAQSFEYGYASSKSSSANKSFVGNANPNLYDPMKNQIQKEASSFMFRQFPEQSSPVQQTSKQSGRNMMFDEKKSEELFKSISEGFGFIGKRTKPEQINEPNTRDISANDEISSESNHTSSHLNSSSDYSTQKTVAKSSPFDFNQQFNFQKKPNDFDETRNTPPLSNSLDSFIDSANLFPSKPANELPTSPSFCEFSIPDELSKFLESNSLAMKQVGDSEIWKANFKKLYRKYEEVKNNQKVPFASIIENQNKFINFCFIDNGDITRYLKVLDSSKQEITRDDYLMFIDKAMEAFSEKKEGEKTIVKELHDNVAQ